MTTSSYGSGPITHTIETLTWRELATEYATTLRTHIPRLRIELRRETWMPAPRIAA